MKIQMPSETDLENCCKVIALNIISFSSLGGKKFLNSPENDGTGVVYKYRFHIFAMPKQSSKWNFTDLAFLIFPLMKIWG